MARNPHKRNKRTRLFDSQGGKCAFCGCNCHFEGSGSDPFLFTIEHMHPLELGGTNDMYNLVGACFECNKKRNHEFDRLVSSGLKRLLLMIRLIERRVLNENRRNSHEL